MMSRASRIEPSTGVTKTEREELDLLRSALDASGDVVYAWDVKTDAIAWSFNAHRAFGLDDTTDISTHSNFVARVAGEDLSILARIHDHCRGDGESYQAEYRLRGDNGGFCWVQDRGVMRLGEDGARVRAIGAIRIITERKENEAQLGRLTNFDEVTGHYNRVHLRELLDQRSPYLDILSYLQVELLDRKRNGRDLDPEDPSQIHRAIQLTVNGIAAGLRNTG